MRHDNVAVSISAEPVTFDSSPAVRFLRPWVFKLLKQFTPREWTDLNARVQADIDEAKRDAAKNAS